MTRVVRSDKNAFQTFKYQRQIYLMIIFNMIRKEVFVKLKVNIVSPKSRDKSTQNRHLHALILGCFDFIEYKSSLLIYYPIPSSKIRN